MTRPGANASQAGWICSLDSEAHTKDTYTEEQTKREIRLTGNEPSQT